MKILIVERDLILLETMKEICHEEKLTPVTTRNCDEAGKLLTSGYVPDLILCDEFLPQLNGVKWRNELAQHSDWKEIPFVLMRGNKSNLNELQFMELRKPFSIEDMLEVFQKIRLSSQTRT